MRPNPDLLDELYHKQQKTFPGELPFPERFNLKLTKDAFNKGNKRTIVKKKQKHVKGFGKDRKEWETDISVIEYERPSRLDLAITNSLPKLIQNSENTDKAHSQLYNNIQFGTAIINDDVDLEYMFHIYPLDSKTANRLKSFDLTSTWHTLFETPLKVRFQYAARYTNSAGSYWEIYGYIYIPQRKK